MSGILYLRATKPKASVLARYPGAALFYIGSLRVWCIASGGEPTVEEVQSAISPPVPEVEPQPLRAALRSKERELEQLVEEGSDPAIVNYLKENLI